jgi:hypothetical protein
MPNHADFKGGRASLVRRLVFCAAVMALGLTAIVHPGPTDATMSPPSGSCAVSGSIGSSSPPEYGIFTDRIDPVDPPLGTQSGASACPGLHRPHVVVERAPVPESSPRPTPVP